MLGTTGQTSSRFLPGVPTFVEQGYKDVVINDWFGIFVAAKTPAAKVQQLSSALKTTLSAPALIKSMEERGVELRWSTPSELETRLKADLELWEPIVKSLKFTATT